jgi:hypothetical protein
MARNMGFDFGLENPSSCFKQKNRWLFILEGISADKTGITALPPARGARPSLSFKESEAQHLNETVYYPSKPEWKPINLTLYDIKKEGATTHPIFEYFKKYYDPQQELFSTPNKLKLTEATLELYDGCGNIIETWKFENVYASGVEFGDLDMTTSDIVYCDLTLRYDRAYYI